MDAETLARLFHETYERLAPVFDYETRRDSAVPWDQVPEQNRKLMVAVAGEILLACDLLASADVAYDRSFPDHVKAVLRGANAWFDAGKGMPSVSIYKDALGGIESVADGDPIDRARCAAARRGNVILLVARDATADRIQDLLEQGDKHTAIGFEPYPVEPTAPA